MKLNFSPFTCHCGHCGFKSSLFVKAISNPLYLSMPFQILFICHCNSNSLCHCQFKFSLSMPFQLIFICHCHFKSSLFVNAISNPLYLSLPYQILSVTAISNILFICQCHFKYPLYLSMPFQISSLFVNAISNPLCSPLKIFFASQCKYM